MARRVFFSFHYTRDVRRIVQVRNSWVVRPGDEADFEQVKQRAGGIDKWIETQLAGCSVTVVLFGRDTYDRPWVRHEIRRSYELGKGIIAIDIHNVKDPQLGTDTQGKNPLSYWSAPRNGRDVPFDQIYSTYDWVNDNGYQNLPTWIETAAKAAGR
jgi:hypothetical protein